MSKKALITGITGQDGSYLAEFLLEKGYRVCGVVRRSSGQNLERIHHILDRIELIAGDLLDQGSLTLLLRQVQPDEVYNLAAQSFVSASWNQPILTGEATALGATRLLEAIRLVKQGGLYMSPATQARMFNGGIGGNGQEPSAGIPNIKGLSKR